MNGNASQATTAQGAAYSPYDTPQAAHALPSPSPTPLSLEAQAALEAQATLSLAPSPAHETPSQAPTREATLAPTSSPQAAWTPQALSPAPPEAWEIEEKPPLLQPVMLVLDQPMLCECGKQAIFLTIEGALSDLDMVAWCQSCFEQDEEQE